MHVLVYTSTAGLSVRLAIITLQHFLNIIAADFRFLLSSPVVTADALGFGARDALVFVGMIVPEDTGAAVTTGICTSTHNAD